MGSCKQNWAVSSWTRLSVHVLMFCRTLVPVEMFDVDNVKYLNYLIIHCIISEKLRNYHIHLQLDDFCILFFKIKALNVKHSASLHVFIAVILEKQ